MKFTKKELIDFAEKQRILFDEVHLVDDSMSTQYTFTDDGKIKKLRKECYTSFGKEDRCENCIAAEVFQQKGTLCKLEFLEKEIALVLCLYIEVSGAPYVMEMILNLSNDALQGRVGKNSFVPVLDEKSRKRYIDNLTKAYNKRYYDEQIRNMNLINSLVVIDIDNLKDISKTCGEKLADSALVQVSKLLFSCIRGSDALIRMEDERFLLIFQGIPRDVLATRLEYIQNEIRQIKTPKFPDVKISTSIGAIFSRETPLDYSDFANVALSEAKKQTHSIIIKDIYDIEPALETRAPSADE